MHVALQEGNNKVLSAGVSADQISKIVYLNHLCLFAFSLLREHRATVSFCMFVIQRMGKSWLLREVSKKVSTQIQKVQSTRPSIS